MAIWKSPFNKVVRSSEAGIVGLLVGLIMGVAIASVMPTMVNKTVYGDPVTLCGGTIKDVESVTFTFRGKLAKVECKNSQVFTEF